MKRFGYSKKKAIDVMKKHKMDTSFLKKEGSCGYSTDGEGDDKPAGSHLIKKESVNPQLLNKLFDKLKTGNQLKIKYDSSIKKGTDYVDFIVTSPKRSVGKRGQERIILKPASTGYGKYYLWRRDGKDVSFAIGDMAAVITGIKK
jgi:hypothetical protein